MNEAVVVADIGSFLSKVGFAGDDEPRVCIPSLGSTAKDGQTAEEDNIRYNSLLPSPLDCKDWEYVESLWEKIFAELHTTIQGSNLLLTENPLASGSTREKTAEILFEKHQISSLYLANRAVIALFSCGRTTGLVLDSGHGSTSAVPVYETRALTHAIRQSNVAGNAITSYVATILAEKLQHPIERSTVRAIKEKCTFVALEYEYESQRAEFGASKISYELPDGNEIALSSERFMCTEPLFYPKRLETGAEEGASHLVLDSIMKCDQSIRKDMYGAICLAGGSTMFPGYSDRMHKEIVGQIAGTIRLNVIAPPDRKLSTWIGGSILASLNTFPLMSISKEEYQEIGPSITDIKCF